jgi:hypothetical protein
MLASWRASGGQTSVPFEGKPQEAKLLQVSVDLSAGRPIWVDYIQKRNLGRSRS